jgi:hypothetical protein
VISDIKMPKMDGLLEHFGIVDWTNLGKRLGEKNMTVSTYQYRLEPMLSGQG